MTVPESPESLEQHRADSPAVQAATEALERSARRQAHLDRVRIEVARHRAEIVDDFLSRDLHAECSCNWVGGQAANLTAAFADHAAHVHVAMGWAVADDGGAA